MLFTQLTALAALFSGASAAVRGWNTASTKVGGVAKYQSDFQSEYQNAKSLPGTNGAFGSVRLYTMIQGDGNSDEVLSAIPAAIAEGTGLLLGLWASAGQSHIDLEIAALQNAISQYGSSFADIVEGISVGSEDLYRTTPTSIANDGGVGAGPDAITSYISQVRDAISGTVLSGVPVGHVDTKDAWIMGSNSAVVAASDFIGVDEYPYYETKNNNTQANQQSLFYAAMSDVQAVADGKPIWITETGYPTTGPVSGKSTPSIANAEAFWKEVYCTIPDSVPVYWFIQYDADANPNFGVTGTSLSETPLYDLSCDGVEQFDSLASAPTTSSTTTSSSSTSTSSSSSTSIAVSTTKTSSVKTTGITTATSTGDSSEETSDSDSSNGTSTGGSSEETSDSESSSGTSTGAAPDSTSTKAATGMKTSNSLFPSVPVTATSSTMMTATSTPATTAQTSTPAPFDSNGAGSTQVYALTLLVVPAVLALMA